MSPKTATAAVLDFVTAARIDQFPAEAIHLAQRCLIDGLGVILAGSTTPGSAVLRDYIREQASRPEATVFARDGLHTSAALAALANGASGHAMDFDDTQLSTTPDRLFGLLTHPTLPPLVAGLALGERLGISGRDLLEAFLIGFEVECKIAEAIDPSHYKKGFHSSGTIGTFGATVSAARLLKLDRAATAHALGIASSFSSGIRVNFGTMTKPLHVGRAAFNGVTAAELAARGFTAGGDALDGPWGYFQIFGGGFDPARIVGVLGNPYAILDPGVSIKPYPCGCLGHPSMDAMLKLVVDHDIEPWQVRRIRLRAGSNILNPLRYRKATTELEAKFCPAFMLSSIAIRRKAGIHEFTDEFVRSAPVQEMMERVETVLDSEIEAQGFEAMRSIVEVELADGRLLVQRADERYRGGPDNPFSRDDLHKKFHECGALVLPAERLSAVLARVESLTELRNVRELIQALDASEPLAAGVAHG
ncbi:MAG: MmgE/PrpD family protein [Gemmatimonadetes bacterium]|nr:MmgE/PrpD family protein [Gemmatimonadota bacterium]